MSQTQLSYRAHVPQSTIARYERGERNPQTPQLSKLAAALGVSIAALLGETSAKPAAAAAANETVAELRERLESIERELRSLKERLNDATQ